MIVNLLWWWNLSHDRWKENCERPIRSGKLWVVTCPRRSWFYKVHSCGTLLVEILISTSNTRGRHNVPFRITWKHGRQGRNSMNDGPCMTGGWSPRNTHGLPAGPPAWHIRQTRNHGNVSIPSMLWFSKPWKRLSYSSGLLPAWPSGRYTIYICKYYANITQFIGGWFEYKYI
jgi:hypothetical protein